MRKHLIMLGLCALVLGALPTWAQPDDADLFHADGPCCRSSMLQHRLERVAEFLELDAGQSDSWRELVDHHLAAADRHRQRIAQLRTEFRELAVTDRPDLEQAGRVALDLHAEIESGHSARQQLIDELAAVLTPQQRERFETLRLARELAGPGHRRHARHLRGQDWTRR